MQKRQLIINDYKTAEDGLWTLSSCKITKATQVQNFVNVPGRYAPLDLSTALTDGQPYYGNAYLAATLESSEGTRQERTERILHMVNLLDGETVQIEHPDFPGRYLLGRVEITTDTNGLAYSVVRVSATLEPWLYNNEESAVGGVLSSTPQAFTLTNHGKMAVVPTIQVSAQADLQIGGGIWVRLEHGLHQLPDLYLASEESINITGTGAGAITFNWREAVLVG